MAKEQIEYVITVDNREALSAINSMGTAQAKLEGKVYKTNSNIETSWAKVGAAIATATVSIGLIANEALQTEKAFRLLTKQNSDLAVKMATTHNLSLQMSAGFIQTGQSAGLSTEKIKSMMDMAVALGRMYPHESTEMFIDNLSMLNTTGEAQGYIVDVLEQKYGMIDLKTISLADKMKTLNEHTMGVNSAYETNAPLLATMAKNAGNLVKELMAWISLSKEEKKVIDDSVKSAAEKANQDERIAKAKEQIDILNKAIIANEIALSSALKSGNEDGANAIQKVIDKLKEQKSLQSDIINQNKEFETSIEKKEGKETDAIFKKLDAQEEEMYRKADQKSQEEAYNDWFLENEENKNKAILEHREEYSDHWADIEEEKDRKAFEYSEKEMDRLQKEKDMKSQNMETFLQLGATLSSAMNVNNKKDFERQKKLNTVLAIANTANAVTKALASSAPPYNMVQAGMIGAMGAVQIGTIASQQYSARELGGSTIKNRPYLVGERGPEMFVPEGNGQIVPNNQLSGGSSVNVTMNVSAMDNKGFENVLSDKRNLKALTQAVAKGIGRNY